MQKQIIATVINHLKKLFSSKQSWVYSIDGSMLREWIDQSIAKKEKKNEYLNSYFVNLWTNIRILFLRFHILLLSLVFYVCAHNICVLIFFIRAHWRICIYIYIFLWHTTQYAHPTNYMDSCSCFSLFAAKYFDNHMH